MRRPLSRRCVRRPYGYRYSYLMRPLRYSINVTLDGCCDHRAMFADEDLHRHAVENLTRAEPKFSRESVPGSLNRSDPGPSTRRLDGGRIQKRARRGDCFDPVRLAESGGFSRLRSDVWRRW